jgi:predicted aldo/keto reductase-like oxidoreductase
VNILRRKSPTVRSILPPSRDIPRRPLGKTGVEVSLLALGGAHLGRIDCEKNAIKLIHEAIAAGVTFFDNAWEYHDGRSEEWMGKALVGRRHKVIVMTKVCTHGRNKKLAFKQLDESLRRLRTDYIDLWQIHEVIYPDEPDQHFSPNGSIEALVEAKRQGKVRFVGFTGHKDPAIHLKMLQYGFPWDACQLPLSVFDSTFRSFERTVLPELTRLSIAPLAMKSLGGNGDPIRQGILTAEEALRYVLSLPIASVVSGVDSLEVLHQNLTIARQFTPMTEDEMEALRRRVETYASDGRFEGFKSSQIYDSAIGREQHRERAA